MSDPQVPQDQKDAAAKGTPDVMPQAGTDAAPDPREPVPGARDSVPGTRPDGPDSTLPPPPDPDPMPGTAKRSNAVTVAKDDWEGVMSFVEKAGGYIKDLEARLDKRDQDDAPAESAPANADGGTPVPYDLTLQDGTVVPGHEGLATHVDMGNGPMRVVAAYPVPQTDNPEGK